MKPVFHEVKAALLARLRQLPAATRLPSDRELAREFNVAFLTIHRVMSELGRDGHVVRLPRRGTFTAGHERTATTHRGGAAGTALIAYPDYFSHQYFRHVRLAGECAAAARLRLVEYKLTPTSAPEGLAAFAAGCADLRLALVLPVPPLATPKAQELLAGLGRPVVYLASTLEGVPYRTLHWRDVDWFLAGRLAAETLLRAGHRRIAWVNHEARHPDDIARGMRQALKDRGMRGSDLATIGHGIEAWSDARESGYRLTQRLLADGAVTGAYYDSVAGVRGALRALWESGLRAPEHLSLIANGMQNGDEDYLTPPLTTLDADWEGGMRSAFAIIQGATPPPARGGVIAVRLHERGSIAGPRG